MGADATLAGPWHRRFAELAHADTILNDPAERARYTGHGDDITLRYHDGPVILTIQLQRKDLTETD